MTICFRMSFDIPHSAYSCFVAQLAQGFAISVNNIILLSLKLQPLPLSLSLSFFNLRFLHNRARTVKK